MPFVLLVLCVASAAWASSRVQDVPFEVMTTRSLAIVRGTLLPSSGTNHRVRVDAIVRPPPDEYRKGLRPGRTIRIAPASASAFQQARAARKTGVNRILLLGRYGGDDGIDSPTPGTAYLWILATTIVDADFELMVARAVLPADREPAVRAALGRGPAAPEASPDR
jgi:hypothetical protein